MALAYFITFTTYGTWLHGNTKGSVDDEHNVYGTPFLEPDAQQKRRAREAMAQPLYVMSAEEREIACKAMVELARDRGWDLLALHVRSTHVLSAERDPQRLMSDLKGRASRDLALAGFDDAKRRRWTRHGSTRHLFRQEEVDAAVRYTLDGQGEPAAWYSKEPRTK